MKISFNWLKSYINLDLSPEETSEILTDTGLEVEKLETYESIPGMLEGVVVGKVLESHQHPDADRLKVTRVDVGTNEDLQIVCGAPNVAAGQKVLVATVGTVLFQDSESPLKIKRAKIRGVESKGMICAEDELGLGDSHDGIMVLPDDTPVGKLAKELFNLETDHVFEIGLTPNRTDAFGHFGVARDIAARLSLRNKVRASLPVVNENAPGDSNPVKVVIEDLDGCGRYAGITIDNLQVAPSPDWLQMRLRSIGLTPINNVVDITNFVQHETGQPLHAFDRSKIEGDTVVVKSFPKGTKFITLDEQERELEADDLMIANAKEPMCIAGIFGGIHSGVSNETKSVFIESAWFNPVRIRKSAKRHGLNTDASFRFERGVDPQGVLYALNRATDLILEVCGGEVVGSATDVHHVTPQPVKIHLSIARINSLSGLHLESSPIESILDSLDFEIVSKSNEGFEVIAPTYRVDVTREVDVIEEILRIYGYNKVESPERMSISVGNEAKPNRDEVLEVVCNNLIGRGLTEIMSNGLTNSAYFKEGRLLSENESLVEILNPLSSELDVLRPHLLSSMLEAMAHNLNRQSERLALFEIGKVYKRKGAEYHEHSALSIGLCGSRFIENWNNPSLEFDMSDLLGNVSAVFQAMGLEFEMGKAQSDKTYSLVRPIFMGRKQLGEIGILHPKYLKVYGIKRQVLVASINLDECLSAIRHAAKTMKPLHKFPSVRRDLSLLLDEGVKFEQIKNIALSRGGSFLEGVNLFDVYEGKNLPEGKKSYAVSFVLRDQSKTLTDKKIDFVMSQVQSALETELGASLR
jgi:phenylalanyl-tRNA synthetase beta chain